MKRIKNIVLIVLTLEAVTRMVPQGWEEMRVFSDKSTETMYGFKYNEECIVTVLGDKFTGEIKKVSKEFCPEKR